MATTSRGIVYPAATDHDRMWEHMQALATSTDTAIGTVSNRLNDQAASGYVKLGGVLIQWGRVTINGSGGATAGATVTFPTPFLGGSSPQVVATPLASSIYLATASTPSATSVTITFRDRNDASIGGSSSASWIAIGAAPTS